MSCKKILVVLDGEDTSNIILDCVSEEALRVLKKIRKMNEINRGCCSGYNPMFEIYEIQKEQNIAVLPSYMIVNITKD
mgnify:CR=1 FL=1